MITSQPELGVPQLPLCGTTITLRDWRTADLDRWEQWLQPGHEWKQFDGPYYALPSAEQRSTMLAARRTAIAQAAWPTPRHTLVIAERASDVLLGMVSWDWESEETFWPSLGIVIYDPAYWNGGRGYQALGLWSDYVFNAMPAVARLDLRTWSGNHRMMALAIKLGYQQEARFRRARIVDGAFYDGMGYGVLREEWQQRYPFGFVPQLCQNAS